MCWTRGPGWVILWAGPNESHQNYSIMEPPPQTQDTQSEAPPPPVMSLAERMTSVISAPSDAFDAVRDSPPSLANWVVPALLLILVSWIGIAVLFSQPALSQQALEAGRQAMEKQLAKQNLPPAQAERMRQIQEEWGPVSAKILIGVTPVFVGFAGPFIWGLFVWLLGAKAFKGGFAYMKAVEAVGLANVVVVLESVVRTLLVLCLNNVYASPSLALLVTSGFDPQNTTHLLLSTVNVMTFWVLAVRSAGLARLARVSFGKAAACVFGIWLTYTGVGIGLQAASKAIMSGIQGS